MMGWNVVTIPLEETQVRALVHSLLEIQMAGEAAAKVKIAQLEEKNREAGNRLILDTHVLRTQLADYQSGVVVALKMIRDKCGRSFADERWREAYVAGVEVKGPELVHEVRGLIDAYLHSSHRYVQEVYNKIMRAITHEHRCLIRYRVPNNTLVRIEGSIPSMMTTIDGMADGKKDYLVHLTKTGARKRGKGKRILLSTIVTVDILGGEKDAQGN